MVVFDSSIIIDALKKKKIAIELIESYSGKELIATTVINKYEILRGTSEKDASLVSGLLSQFIILDLEDSAVDEMVKIYKKLAAKGKMVNEFDLLIAGIVAVNDETLLTKDKDFLNLESSSIMIMK
jgi:predicted nucleic acid-binding protein